MATFNATFARYSIYTSKIGDLVFSDMSDFNFRSASNKSSVIPGGDIHPRAIVNCCADPMATFSTKDLGTVFTDVDLRTGYAVNANNASTGASLFQYQLRTDGAAFTSSGTAGHTIGTNNKGFLTVSEISAQQDDVSGAKCSMEYTLLSDDGLLDPVTWNKASTLANAPAFEGIWYLGPVVFGQHGSSTNAMQGVQSVSIRSGVNYHAPRADGCVFAGNGSISSVVPEIRIRTLDFTKYTSTLGVGNSGGGGSGGMFGSQVGSGSSPSGTSFVIYFQKGIHGGGREPRSNAVHCMVVISTGDATTDNISVQQLDDATTEIIIRPTGGIVGTAGVVIN